MDVDKAINKRKSVRSFGIKKVKWHHILEAVDAASQAPFAGNKNTLKFLIVTESALKDKIAQYADQEWIADADTIVVVCSDESMLEKLYDERGKRYNAQQAGAAIENFLLKITDLGLSACWVGAYLDAGIKRTLSIPEHVFVEAIIPVGYEKGKTKSPKKDDIENSIYWDKWNVSKKPTLIKDPDTW